MTPNAISSFGRLSRLSVAGLLALGAFAAQAAPPAVVSYQDRASLPFHFGEEVGWPLVQGGDGLAYGAASWSSEFETGLLFRFEADGTRTILSQAVQPTTALVPGPDGGLYGAAASSGPADLGSIFRLTTDGQVQTVHTFTASADQGLGNPHAALVADGSGGWYGVGYVGTAETLFQLDAGGTVTLLAKFVGPKVGKYVQNLARTSNGTLVGITLKAAGGTTIDGALFVYKPGGRVRMIHDFTGTGDDGASPRGALAVSSDGAVYGTTFYGGTWNNGTAWRVGNDAQYRVVRQFELNGGDPIGGEPVGFTASADGQLYGATNLGGPKMGGTVYRMSHAGDAHRLHAFDYSSPFTQPYSPNIAPAWFSDDSLNGLTTEGGAFFGGSLFRIGLD